MRDSNHGGPHLTSRTLRLGRTSYPLVLPSVRDPRLHVAAVIITIHVLGQVGLGFRVSVPQVVAAILTCAILEVAITFRQSRAFVWPASAMLTGSGVALIFRVVGTPVGDHWTTYAWWVFAVVAGLSLLTKYVFRFRGSHLFNPSNIGLVIAFVLLGSQRVEPLDFWWAPFDGWLIAAYAVILVGGVLITRRLHLLELAVAFWVVFAAGLGVLAASGHCMTANWAFAPVCGNDFWRVIVTSPEVLIFLFFMITDPRTVPVGRIGRIAFGALVAVSSVLIIAPQTDEFGAKVGLLAGLAIVSAARPFLDRLLPQPKTPDDQPAAFVGRLVGGRRRTTGVARRAARLAMGVTTVLVAGAAIIAAGTPARGVVVPDATELLSETPAAIDPATLPNITVGQDVLNFDPLLAGPQMQSVVVTLAQNLEIENQALLRHDASLLVSVDHGDRLTEMRTRLQIAARTGVTTVVHYRFDTIRVSLLLPFGQQTGLSLGMASRGTVTTESYDASGTRLSTKSEPFAQTFVVRRATGARWLNVAVLP